MIFDMAGWDPARDKEITLEDPCPERITIEVVDRDSGAPLEGVNLIMHPYRTTTDRNGMARMKVVADHYLLHASGLRRVPYRDHLDATRPIELRILMAVEQQEGRRTTGDNLTRYAPVKEIAFHPDDYLAASAYYGR